MKTHFTFLCFFFLSKLLAQTADTTANCYDRVILRDGSEFVGQVLEYEPDKTLIIKTWSGLMLHVPPQNLRRVLQHCGVEPVWKFPARGWYHATKVGIAPKLTDDYDLKNGFLFHHSSGYKFNRFFGMGLGAGVENLRPGASDDIADSPVFLDLRGYFSSGKMSPLYAIGFGWAIPIRAYRDTPCFDCFPAYWRGGLFAQIEFGYRFGNHFFTTFGWHYQAKKVGYTEAFLYSEVFHRRYITLSIGILM